MLLMDDGKGSDKKHLVLKGDQPRGIHDRLVSLLHRRQPQIFRCNRIQDDGGGTGEILPEVIFCILRLKDRPICGLHVFFDLEKIARSPVLRPRIDPYADDHGDSGFFLCHQCPKKCEPCKSHDHIRPVLLHKFFQIADSAQIAGGSVSLLVPLP